MKVPGLQTKHDYSFKSIPSPAWSTNVITRHTLRVQDINYGDDTWPGEMQKHANTGLIGTIRPGGAELAKFGLTY